MGSGGVPSGCGQFLRCLIVAVNFMLLLLSIGLIAVISYSIVKTQHAAEMAPKMSFGAYLALSLAIPILAMVISFLGCCGAFYENKCMLIIYSVIVGLLIVLFVVAFGLAIVYKSTFMNLKDQIKDELKEKLEDYKPDSNNKWDAIQSELKCCGVEGPADWSKAGIRKIPQSCYRQGNDIYQQGCFNVIEDNIIYYSPIIIGCIVTLIIFMMISICSVGVLVKSINSYSEMV